MRPLFAILAAAMVLTTGCTHTALERRTVKQASTLTDLQYKQVLDNAAMFAINPEAMPWHVKIKGGLIQIADQGSGAFGADIGAAVGEVTRLLPSGAAQRGILNQWEVDPATDPDELEMLQLAYKKAINPSDDEVRKKILDKICELSVRFDLLPSDKSISDILDMPNEKGQHEGVETMERIIGSLFREVSDPKASASDVNFKKHQISVLFQLLSDQAKGKIIEELAQKYCKAKENEAQKRLEFLWQLSPKENIIKKIAQECCDPTKSAELKDCSCMLKTLWEITRTRDKHKMKDMVKTFDGCKHVKDIFDGKSKDEAKDPEPNPIATASARQSRLRGADRVRQDPKYESDTMLLILTAMHDACPSGYLPSTNLKWETERNAALIDQAEDKIKKLEFLMNDPAFQTPWLNCGQKHDMPKCACYVGHYRGCQGDRYVWVMPEGLKTLREFTLVILTLAPIEKQDVVSGRGAAFSPSFR